MTTTRDQHDSLDTHIHDSASVAPRDSRDSHVLKLVSFRRRAIVRNCEDLPYARVVRAMSKPLDMPRTRRTVGQYEQSTEDAGKGSGIPFPWINVNDDLLCVQTQVTALV